MKPLFTLLAVILCLGAAGNELPSANGQTPSLQDDLKRLQGTWYVAIPNTGRVQHHLTFDKDRLEMVTTTVGGGNGLRVERLQLQIELKQEGNKRRIVATRKSERFASCGYRLVGDRLIIEDGEYQDEWAQPTRPDDRAPAPAAAGETKARHVFQASGGITALAISADGATLAVASGDKTVKLWDTVQGTELTTLRGFAAPVTAMAFSADGKTMATLGKDRTVRVWNVQSGKESIAYRDVHTEAGLLAIAADGKVLLAYVASGAEGEKTWAEIRVVEVASGKQRTLDRQTGHIAVPGIGPNFSLLGFTPDGMGLAMKTYDVGGTVHMGLLDTTTGKGLEKRLPVLHENHRLAFSRDGKTAATGTERAFQTWDLATGKMRSSHQGFAGIALIAADLRTVVCVGPKDTVEVREAPAGLELNLIAKTATYQLNFGGKSVAEYRKPLDEMAQKFSKVPFIPYLDARFLPACPVVDLVLEIRNTSDRDIEIWVGGEYTHIHFDLQGPGVIALNRASMMSIAPRPKVQPAHKIKLAPGAYYGLPIKSLQDGDPTSPGYPLGKHFYWTNAGEYTLAATWELAIAAEQGGGVKLISAPITLRVDAPNKESARTR